MAKHFRGRLPDIVAVLTSRRQRILKAVCCVRGDVTWAHPQVRTTEARRHTHTQQEHRVRAVDTSPDGWGREETRRARDTSVGEHTRCVSHDEHYSLDDVASRLSRTWRGGRR